MNPRIIQLSKTRFQIDYPKSSHPVLTIDFDRVLSEARKHFPDDAIVLKHWQAKPIGLRRWGVFCFGVGTSYLSYWPEQMESFYGESLDIQVSEGDFQPTAVIAYPRSVVEAEGDRLRIKQLGKVEDGNDES